MEESGKPIGRRAVTSVRDPLARPDAVLEARGRPMSERLELALSWNTVADELRAGLAKVIGTAKPSQ
jgi:hypothetical protein